MINWLLRYAFKRRPFKGQMRGFLWLYNSNILKRLITVSSPIIGNFKINLDTSYYIDAAIYFTGDYEPHLKNLFKDLITEGMTVLDVGANIGFHSLYFAELVGKSGQVISFEPIDKNFHLLQENIVLNNFSQIRPVMSALGSETETILMYIDETLNNPGAYNVFETKGKEKIVQCYRGDDFLSNLKLKIGFIKIDVEGFENEVLDGLRETIQKDRPTIIFEYDQNYQLKCTQSPSSLFSNLLALGYCLKQISSYGKIKEFEYKDSILSADILAIPMYD